VRRGFSAPRTWSLELSGAKREGVSAPGVGATWTAVHAGGVGMIRLGIAGCVLIAVAGEFEQAERKKVRRLALRNAELRKEKGLSMFNPKDDSRFLKYPRSKAIGQVTINTFLFDRLLELLERCHPCNRVDEICE